MGTLRISPELHFFSISFRESSKLLLIKRRNLNLASDIWKRLFAPRSRRSAPILPIIRLARQFNQTMEFINPFKLCSGLKFLGYFMILLVFAIVAVSYDAVVVLTWGPKLLMGGFRSFLAFSIIILFHVLVLILFFLNFWVIELEFSLSFVVI